MEQGKVYREIADCLELLRWTLTGYHAGGVTDWPHSPSASLPPPPRSTSPAPLSEPQEADRETLSDIAASLSDCARCRLQKGRRNLVFGEGSASSGLVFVGEGPGYDEDREGRPFVGRAGKLLNKMIRAIGLDREEVFICNVVKCRPPENRTPEPDEIEACSPFLFRQLDALRPKVICALGACAAQTLLRTSRSVSLLRGRAHQWRGIPLICTYHPAYLLRNSAQKAASWHDLKEVLRVLHTQAPD